MVGAVGGPVVSAIQSTSFAWRLEACLAMGRPEFSEAARGSTSHTTKATLQAGAIRHHWGAFARRPPSIRRGDWCS